MRAPKAKKTDIPHNQFVRWRRQLKLNQEQAAHLLGKKKRTVQDYERRELPARPSYTDRVVMAMIAAGLEVPKPWPDDDTAEAFNKKVRELR